MNVASVLIVVALVITAFFTLTAAIIAVAPYIAIGAIIGGIVWSIGQKTDEPPPPPQE